MIGISYHHDCLTFYTYFLSKKRHDKLKRIMYFALKEKESLSDGSLSIYKGERKVFVPEPF